MVDKLKVLIVDDSRIFRSALEEALKNEAGIEVVGSVWNGVKALEYIRKSPPDLVTLDVEMPEMDGLTTLRAIQRFNEEKQGPPDIGVIMVSSHTHSGADATIKALEAGAFDFVKKPEGESASSGVKLLRELLAPRMRNFAFKAKKRAPKTTPPVSTPGKLKKEETSPGKILLPGVKEVVVIGVSTGGPKALVLMLPGLCEVVNIPILIVQHMPPLFTKSLADSLDSKCSAKVVEAKNDQKVANSHVYIAPGGQHMLVRRNEQQEVVLALNTQSPENGCRPSVDVLFRSAAMTYKKHVIAIILTGMGNDGTKGLGPLKRAGASVIVQDEATSVVWGMPGSAVESGLVDRIAPIEKIAETVQGII
ncbi:MAG: chemotaxis response regulator protein-glutamate methylesterase [Nitrospinota bacterium]